MRNKVQSPGGAPEVLLTTVIKGGYCIGCGVCASVAGSQFNIKLDENGCLQADLSTDAQPINVSSIVLDVCPFYAGVMNEDKIGKELFGKDCRYSLKIGYWLKNFAGYVLEGDYRAVGGSGGMGTWLIAQLFERGLIDGVLHVLERTPTDQDRRVFEFGISRSIEEARKGAKSKYYPVEMSEVLKVVKKTPGRYALVGVPCFLKAVRLLSIKDDLIASSVKYFIGLVCGHMKSTRFAEMQAWQHGIHPRDLLKITFRHKEPGRPANNSSVLLEGRDGDGVRRVLKPISDFYGYDWGRGLFKYEACDYCDDVFAETADITIGDAWLPKYIADAMGTNIVVVRNSCFLDIINNGVALGKLRMDTLTLKDTIKSQARGLFHRREGLAYRLFLKDKAGLWRPEKRVRASFRNVSEKRKKIFEKRMEFRTHGFTAFSAGLDSGGFEQFRRSLEPLNMEYDLLYKPTLWQRLINKLIRIVKKCFKLCKPSN